MKCDFDNGSGIFYRGTEREGSGTANTPVYVNIEMLCLTMRGKDAATNCKNLFARIFKRTMR